MFNEGNWGKPFYFIGLCFLTCSSNASLSKFILHDEGIQNACLHNSEPGTFRRSHDFFINQPPLKRQRELHLLPQHIIFSIQTYDHRWSEYQLASSCSAPRKLFTSGLPDTEKQELPFTPFPAHEELSKPLTVFALQESLN